MGDVVGLRWEQAGAERNVSKIMLGVNELLRPPYAHILEIFDRSVRAEG